MNEEREEHEQYNDPEDASTSSASEYASHDGAAAMLSALHGGGSYGGSGAPCGACKFLRRKCIKDCVFAPFFGAEHGASRFAAVHKIFGASNVNKLLRSIPAHKRYDAVITISYEAQARITNPVYGCVAAIADLQQQVQSLQTELNIVHSQLENSRQLAAASCMVLQQQQQVGHGGGAFLPFDQTQSLEFMHMISPPISSPPVASYIRPKHDLQNIVQPCIQEDYDSLPLVTSPTASLVNHMHEHTRPHISIDLSNKTDDVDAPSTNASQLQALLHTDQLNLEDST